MPCIPILWRSVHAPLFLGIYGRENIKEENLMKKRALLTVFICMALAASQVFSFTACGGEENKGDTSGGGTNIDKPNEPTEGDKCNGLEIKTMPTKLEYKAGEKFTPVGLTFDATYENGFVEEDLTAGDLDGWRPSAALTPDIDKVTIIFEGFEYDIDITVEPKTLLSMEIATKPSVLSYSIGSTIDFGGMDVMATYEEDDEPVNETNYKVTDASGKEYISGETVLDTSGTIELTVTVTSGEISMSDTFTIEVVNGFSVQVEDVAGDPAPESGSYSVVPNADKHLKTDLPCTGSEGNTSGYAGDFYTDDTMEFHIWSDKAVENVDLILVAASTLINDAKGQMDDMTFSEIFEVTVDGQKIEYVDPVIIPGNPFPEAGSNANRWAMWENVNIGTIDLNEGYTVVVLKCLETPKDSQGNYRAGNFDRLDVVYPEYIANPCTYIEITTQPKTAYTEGEAFDPSDLVFTATYKDGTKAEGLTADVIEWSPKRPLTTADKTITITYMDCEKEIAVTVAEKKITSLAVTKAPNRIVFAKGEVLDLTGMEVTATYEDHTTEIITDFTLKDADEKLYILGETTLDAAGELTLTLTAASGGASATTTLEISVFDGITVQAEATGEHGENQSYVELQPIKSGSGVRVKNGAALSEGDACIESIVKGDKVVFKVYAAVAGDYDFVVRLCSTLRRENGSGTLAADLDKVFKVTVGDTPLDISGVEVPELDLPEGGSIWFNWQDVDFGTVHLEAGYNTIVFECIDVEKDYQNQDRVPNLDAIDLVYANA